MTEEQLDAEIRAAFEQLEPPDALVHALEPRPVSTWRVDAVFVGVAAVAALALFVPYMLVDGPTEDAPDVAMAPAGFQPPAGTRVIQLDVAGVHEGWPEAGAIVDVVASRVEAGEVSADTLLSEVVVAETAHEGGLSIAVDPSMAVRAIHGSQTAALTVAVVLPDGRRVVELREGSPVQVGDRVDVLVTGERDGELQTWTALRSVEVVYQGPAGPLVAVSTADAAEAIAIQQRGVIRLSRHLP